MRRETSSTLMGCGLVLVLFGIVGCAADDAVPGDEPTGSTAIDAFNPDLAAAIAKAKMASIDSATAVPHAAACGTAGPTSTSLRVNDVAPGGAARQRSGSSTSCSAPGELQPTDDALYYCFTFGNDGFTWTYNENLRTTVRGWTRDDLLKPPPGATIGGATNFCGF